MDSVRYYVAMMILVATPPSLLYWFVVHPFVRFWRRVGPRWTFAALALPMAALMSILAAAGPRLLAWDYGTSPALLAPAFLSFLTAGTIARKRRRLLTIGILVGVPELSEPGHRGRLITEGIYARIRHPRYVELVFWVLGYALFANFPAVYLLAVLMLPVLYLLVVVEERELRDRFGAAYEEYCRQVPRFIPRRMKVRGSADR